jgi:type VI secretion system protein VasJ
MLKRLYLQQSWLEILEQADSTFSRGANHLWLDLQWYIHQALVKLGQDVLADIIAADLKGLLRRLTGLETLAFNDGTPFADEVTLNWINQSVLDDMSGWRDEPVSAGSERITISCPRAGSAGESGHGRSGCGTPLAADPPGHRLHKRQMAAAPADGAYGRAEGQNELALHLLGELDSAAQSITLTQWTPALLFEVKSRRLRLLRMKASRSETDKSRLQPEMDLLCPV